MYGKQRAFAWKRKEREQRNFSTYEVAYDEFGLAFSWLYYHLATLRGSFYSNLFGNLQASLPIAYLLVISIPCFQLKYPRISWKTDRISPTTLATFIFTLCSLPAVFTVKSISFVISSTSQFLKEEKYFSITGTVSLCWMIRISNSFKRLGRLAFENFLAAGPKPFNCPSFCN